MESLAIPAMGLWVCFSVLSCYRGGVSPIYRYLLRLTGKDTNVRAEAGPFEMPGSLRNLARNQRGRELHLRPGSNAVHTYRVRC